MNLAFYKQKKSDTNIDIALDKVARPVNIPKKSIGPLHLSKRVLITRHKQQT
ncbi:hypothetical protein THOD04_40212 [Vibrio owensii]|nr:hypothetical protein THOD04_40212 [Vibrio owensii]